MFRNFLKFILLFYSFCLFFSSISFADMILLNNSDEVKVGVIKKILNGKVYFLEDGRKLAVFLVSNLKKIIYGKPYKKKNTKSTTQ